VKSSPDLWAKVVDLEIDPKEKEGGRKERRNLKS
jgi:hypothetical protein